MLQQLILCFIGFCAGIIVAGGVSGLLIGLSIVPRYAGITHTADCIFLYEDSSLLGTVAGTIACQMAETIEDVETFIRRQKCEEYYM